MRCLIKTSVLIGVLCLPLVILADAEIMVPPGTTDDIITVFTPSLKVTTQDKIIQTGTTPAPVKPKPTTGTNVKKLPPPILPPKAPPPMNVNFEELMGLGAADFDIEFPQLAKITIPNDPIIEDFRYKTDEYEVIRAKCDVYFKCYVRGLMRLFHNNRLLDNEDIFYLLLHGDPAGSFTGNIDLLTANLNAGGYFKKALGYIDPETNKPVIPSANNPYKDMITKLAIYELLVYSPFTVSTPYAPGLDNFAQEEMYYLMRELTNHPNKRVKRNAIYYLGTMSKYEPLENLYRALKTTKDNVEKARIIFLLTQARFEGFDDFLIDNFQNEKDEVFKIAYINSLRKLRSKKAFKLLVDNFINTDGDFEMRFALLRACIACLDPKDKKNYELLLNKCSELYKSFDYKVEWGQDPPPHIPGAPSYKNRARFFTMQQTLEIALAVMGDEEVGTKVKDNLRKTAERFAKYVGDVDAERNPAMLNFGQGSAQSWVNGLGIYTILVRFFVAEELPGLGETGKYIIEQLISKAAENDNILFLAFKAYAREYSLEETIDLALTALDNENMPITVKDRIIKFLYANQMYNNRVKDHLKQIISKYKQDMTDEQKHLVSISIFYLTIDKDKLITDKAIINVLESEWKRTIKETKFSQDLGIYYIKFPRINYLLEVSIESLGRYSTPNAEKELLKLSKTQHDEININRLVVKTLGNFKSEEVKERLFTILTYDDGWTRLNAYLSLNRITRVDHKIDWYFEGKSELSMQIDEYKKKILASKPAK
ncbi:MAG: HEAT repeat domain-containing protein [Planctomycetes bacterium]|nr:HEAT repeat domain-containing protein [Planctomycetota bacterium]